MSRLATAFVLLAALCLPAAHAQLQLGASVQSGLPQHGFHDRLDAVGLGAGGQVLYLPAGLPVGVGVEGSFLTYGRARHALPVRLAEDAATFGEVETAHRMAGAHAVLRLGPARGAVRPYADGLLGFHYVYTSSTLDETVALVSDGGAFIDYGPDAVILRRSTESVAQDDWALSYGGGAGLLVRVAEGTDDGRAFAAYLDLGARYLLGETARYRPVVDGQAGAPTESGTDLLRPYLGLAVRF